MNQPSRAFRNCLILACALPLTGAAQTLATAHSLAKQGKVDAAIESAQQVVAANGKNAVAQELLCSLYSSVERIEDAIHACEAAHASQPGNSQYTLELARAYGAKAAHAGAFTGMRMVGRIRESFEAAVQQDPRNIEALSDLGEFYVDAPSMVGGGTDKARALVPRLQALSPARAARLEAMIAVKTGDAQAAEAAYIKEIAVAHSAEAYVDVAAYDRSHKLWEQAEQNAVLAIQHDRAHGPDTLDAAQILLDINRSLPAAEKGIRSYLSQEQISDIAAYPKAHRMLGEVLQRRGDAAGAQEQFRQALALAAGYEPARKALHG